VRKRGFVLLVVFVLFVMMAPTACRTRGGNAFVIALGDNVRTIDPIGSPSVDAASERVRTLIFNTLVKKDDKFDYVGDLASDIKRSDDGLTYTFALRDGVKFHDGRVLSSADAKYTLDLLFSSNFAKSASFFEGTGDQKRSYIKSVEAPDQRTVVVTLTKSWVGLLSNLVPIPIIPKDSYESQKTHPLGTGPFKFVNYDNTQQVCDLEAFPEYWDGPAKLPQVRVRVIADMNALQAELQAGRVDIAPLPTSLSPDAVKRLEEDPNLQVKAFPGSNVVLLTINTTSPPLDNVKVRQAIAYAIDRQSMIQNLLRGYGKIAHSIIPEESWSYSPGQTYAYDPAMSKKLLAESGVRLDKPVVFKHSGSSI
jgi:peptide/nickel transport system substrate-binding protein